MSRRNPDIQGLTLDAGALIKLQRGEDQVRALLERARALEIPLAVPTGVIGQTWRGRTGPQWPIARLLADSDITKVPLDEITAKKAGVLCGTSGHPDVIDASVVLCAIERGHYIVTTDPGDMEKLSPKTPRIDL